MAKKYNIKNIVRICADRPFISSDFLDSLILFFKRNKCDLALIMFLKKYKFKCIDGFGAEIFSAKTLNQIQYKTKNKKS